MVEFRHILCPIDFSDFSQQAFGQAMAIARRHQSRVTALHVMPLHMPPLSALAMGASAMFEPETRERMRAELTQRLRSFIEAVAGDWPVQVQVEEGNVVGEIVTLAHTLPADLVVMGTHGHGGFERLTLGSVSEKLLRKAPCPVLTVPPAAERPVAHGSFRRVLCATDFSESAERALEHALALAEQGGRVVVVHVLESLPAGVRPSGDAERDAEGYARTLEQDARERLRERVPADSERLSVVQEVRVGKAYEAILRAAQDHDCDLIAMGVRGHTSLENMLFGSTAYHVATRAVCPVLAARELAARRGSEPAVAGKEATA